MQAFNPRVIVAQLGARRHYAIPVLFHKDNCLVQFFTDAYTGSGSWLHYPIYMASALLKIKSLQRLSQRSANLPANKVTAFNLLGFQFAISLRKASRRKKQITDIYLEYGRKFSNLVSDSPHFPQANIVYGFNLSSADLFETAKQRGLLCLCDQMIAPVKVIRKIFREEMEAWPGWQTGGVTEWSQAWTEYEIKEWRLADRIIAPSKYIQQTLVDHGVPSNKINLMPYGTSLDKFKGHIRSFDGSRPLHVLFVGTVDLRKGIPYLLEALQRLGPKKVEARVVGGVNIVPEKLKAYEKVATFTGRVPRSQVQTFYQWADVFVFPSLCEGSAAVTYEARANGLPVITTFNSGAWVEDGVDGLAVPFRSSVALADALQTLIRRPELIEEMSGAALENSCDYSWDVYQRRLYDLTLQMSN